MTDSKGRKETAHADLDSLQIGPTKLEQATSIESLALDHLTEAAQVLLEAMSVLDPDSIPVYILEGNPASDTLLQYLLTSAKY
jgi:hypothetical protein